MGPLHGAELGGVHASPGLRLLHTFWQEDLGPDLEALGGTGRFARLQRVQRRAADQDRAELRVLGCRDGDTLRLVTGRRACGANDNGPGKESAPNERDSRNQG